MYLTILSLPQPLLSSAAPPPSLPIVPSLGLGTYRVHSLSLTFSPSHFRFHLLSQNALSTFMSCIYVFKFKREQTCALSKQMDLEMIILNEINVNS